MDCDEIVAELFRLQDKEYAAFQAKLIPTAEADRIIGVRTPELRALAKKLFKDEGEGPYRGRHGKLAVEYHR